MSNHYINAMALWNDSFWIHHFVLIRRSAKNYKIKTRLNNFTKYYMTFTNLWILLESHRDCEVSGFVYGWIDHPGKKKDSEERQTWADFVVTFFLTLPLMSNFCLHLCKKKIKIVKITISLFFEIYDRSKSLT